MAIETETIEASFLEKLEGEELNFNDLFSQLKALVKDGRRDLAGSLAELLRDAIADKCSVEERLSLLKLRVCKIEKQRSVSRDTIKDCTALLGNTPETRALLEGAGFNGAVDAEECFRRLLLLLHLKPGVLCHDSTWGFGTVCDLDHFYARVEINFEKKRGHEMSFSYAAETLELIDDSHLLGMKYRQSDALDELIKKDPAEVVKIALKSYGSMSVIILIEKLVPEVLPESGWKKFWDGARKGLKKDPLVHLPTKRTEPLELLEKAKAFDDEWFAGLADDKNMQSILQKLEALIGENNPELVTEERAAAIQNRLQFVLIGAEGKHYELTARAVSAAHELGLVDFPEIIHAADSLLKRRSFSKALAGLNAKDSRRFFQFLLTVRKDEALQLWLKILTDLDLTVLNEVIQVLITNDCEEQVRAIIKSRVSEQLADVDLLCWLWRNPGRINQWSVGSIRELFELTMRAVEQEHNGNRLRTQNQLKDFFRKPDWVKLIFEEHDPITRKKMFTRIKESSAWATMDQRSVLGGIIKVYPELEEVMRSRGAEELAAKTRGPVTSSRSYYERQAQLEHIKNVEILRNSKEIALARSYGDLSENHEFKAAKEQQAFLMRKQGELEQMLGATLIAEFSDVVGDEVNIGSRAVLEYPDGKEETYSILGVWDRDESLNIISCETRMAKALTGHSAGDEIQVPSDSGDLNCKIKAVLPLTDEVLAWASEEPPPIEVRPEDPE